MQRNALMCLLMALAGCASHDAAIRCDGRLEPINQPAAKSTRANTSTLSRASFNHSEKDGE